MKYFRTALILACLLNTNAFATDFYNEVPIQLSFFAPTQLFDEQNDVAGLRFGLFYAKNRNVTGLDLGSAFNYVKGDFVGIQLGSFNYVTKEARGVQISPFMNVATQKAYALQAAPLGVNYSKGGGGVQLSLIANVSDPSCEYYGIQINPFMTNIGSVTGIQTALIGNVAWDFSSIKTASNGIQLAGFFNIAEAINGIQLSGFYNTSGKVTGIQLCSITNTSSKMTGLQFGIVNKCKDMTGAQIGLINYSKKLTGFQIGLLNIITYDYFSALPLINLRLD